MADDDKTLDPTTDDTDPENQTDAEDDSVEFELTPLAPGFDRVGLQRIFPDDDEEG